MQLPVSSPNQSPQPTTDTSTANSDSAASSSSASAAASSISGFFPDSSSDSVSDKPQFQGQQQQQQQISNHLPPASPAPAVSPFLAVASHEPQIHIDDTSRGFLQQQHHQNLQQQQLQQQQAYELLRSQHLQLPSLETIGASVLNSPQLPSALAVLTVLFVGRKLTKLLRQPTAASVPASPSPSPSPSPFSYPENISRTPINKSVSHARLSKRATQSASQTQVFNHQTFLHGFHKFVDSKTVVRPPPLTPPEISPSIFTLQHQSSREPEFHHQTNSDYLSDTDADEFFIINNITMPEPSNAHPSVGSSNSGGSTGASQGQTISGQGSQGGTWTRHTVVYGNGPCPCCQGRDGGSYGPNVSPAEKR